MRRDRFGAVERSGGELIEHRGEDARRDAEPDQGIADVAPQSNRDASSANGVYHSLARSLSDAEGAANGAASLVVGGVHHLFFDLFGDFLDGVVVRHDDGDFFLFVDVGKTG